MSDLHRMEQMAKQVSEIHTTVFGVDGQGGLHRWLEKIDKDVDELKVDKHKALGILTTLTILLQIAGHKISGLFK